MDTAAYQPQNKVRIVTAASLFDGHDAAINIMRRLIQDTGVEVIHLGHNRSVYDIVKAAIEEDAQAIAVSSYQGGHNEFFRYMKDLLVEQGAAHVKIFGGGGGVIVAEEIAALQDYGIARIYSPEDGRTQGLQGIINDLVAQSDYDPTALGTVSSAEITKGDVGALSRAITWAETTLSDRARLPSDVRDVLENGVAARSIPVLGITGTGGAGKSSLTDELVRRFLHDAPEGRVAVLSVDPTRKRSGGALLGDRIRMNSIDTDRVYMRSLATRDQKGELSAAIHDAVVLCKASNFDLIIVETSGIGQGDSDITDVADISIYAMTPEFGAQSQLEKIEMLEVADLVVVNKFDRRGAEDALRDVRKQYRRNHKLFDAEDEELPVFGTIAAQWGDPGVDAVYIQLLAEIQTHTGRTFATQIAKPESRATPPRGRIIPPERTRYLGEIADTVERYHRWADEQSELAGRIHALRQAATEADDVAAPLVGKADALQKRLHPQSVQILDGWDSMLEQYAQDEFVYTVRGKEIRQPLVHESLSHSKIRRVATPRYRGHSDRVRWGLTENLPGHFPYTAGVFPLKRLAEEPKRMFAGEGGPEKTNQRFHLLCKGEKVHRLSTAFDSVTLYGEDPHERPDVYGKIGESGVSVPTLDDMKILYSGFDLCAPTTSVSMTINGPAPILLAMFMNTAIEQQVDAFQREHKRQPSTGEREQIHATTLRTVRGTVQADILKEDQAQNTCIFSTEFALKMMGDVQEFFVQNEVRNYYSASISGYHIAEAGANPISQLAFTLSNGFTLVEYYLSRGMPIDSFAHNQSFFFSNGMDPEYTVIGRVARRIWSIAMRDLYGASERGQKLKYHIQTSGRSLHAREIQFNDIRTTLQALLALQDNCNSLHTNAFDEAITTPTDESVRRAMAIQKIINQEFGLMRNENALQGSFIAEELTDIVEQAVLAEFRRIDDRGGVLGAMERQYQRSKIQDESLYYEQLKHSGELPLVGINTFLNPNDAEVLNPDVELRRATTEEKQQQIARTRDFQQRHAEAGEAALTKLQKTAEAGGNLFAELMHCVRVASLGQITHALYAVGGEYRRNL